MSNREKICFRGSYLKEACKKQNLKILGSMRFQVERIENNSEIRKNKKNKEKGKHRGGSQMHGIHVWFIVIRYEIDRKAGR